MSYAVAKNTDGSYNLYVEGELALTGDEDAIDEYLWHFFGTPESD